MAFNRANIRQRIGGAEFINDTIASTATGNGSTTTLVDTSLKQADDFFQYAQIAATSGTNSGLTRYVTDWVQSTSTFTLDRALSASTATNDTYEVHRIFPYTDKNKAISEAMRRAGMRWARRIEDTSLTFAANTYTYALGSLTVPIDPDIGIDQILYDTGTSGTGVPYAVLDDDLWEIRISGTTYTLQVHDIPRASATIRLVYRVRPSVLSDDTTSAVPDSTAFYNFICAKASEILYRSKANSEEGADWLQKADAMREIAEGYFNEDKPQPRGGKVRFPVLVSRDEDYLPVDYGL